MPYLIRVSSQKGGVGKTTVAVNLSIALQCSGYQVLLIDGDTVNPSVGFHLGIEDSNTGVKELLMGKVKLVNARVAHAPSGLHVVPGVLTQEEYIVNNEMMQRFTAIVKNSNYDFVIVDTAPGYAVEHMGKYYNEALLVSTPEMASVANIVRLTAWFDRMHLEHKLVLNKVKGKRYELHDKEIEEMYENRITGKLPEDDIVPLSIEDHIPAYLYSRRCNFSKGIDKLAKTYYAVPGSKVPTMRRCGLLSPLFGGRRRH
jgi:flagellar biosynthesis protein FlhG